MSRDGPWCRPGSTPAPTACGCARGGRWGPAGPPARAKGGGGRRGRGVFSPPVAGGRFVLTAPTPPYLPAADDELPSAGPTRAWDAGRDGRALIDPICAAAPRHL